VFGKSIKRESVTRRKFSLKAYDNTVSRYFLYMRDGFTIFGEEVDEKITLKVLTCSFEITY
jgi:hypothetical protein